MCPRGPCRLSRSVAPATCSSACAGEHADGGAFAAAAIEAGAWGAIVGPTRRPHLASSRRHGARVFESADPLAALGTLARHGSTAARGGCRVVGITGSTGKTSTKDILFAMLAPPFGGRVHANRENFNTEIGLPLTVLEADIGIRAAGARDGDAGHGPDPRAGRIARPDVGVITNIGPVHLELVGTVDGSPRRRPS